MIEQFFGDKALGFLFLGTVFAISIILAMRHSSYLLDWLFVVTTFNREVRRILDWYNGYYDPTPLTSLTPQIIAIVMFASVGMKLHALGRDKRQAAILFGLAIAYGSTVGLRFGMAVFYSVWSYVLPLVAFFYASLCNPGEKTVQRWERTIVICGLVSACYGVYQWAVVPEWDKDWIMASGMFSSMGIPLPYNFNICSTLSSRGTAAWFFAVAIVVAITQRQWRTAVSWPIVSVIVFAVLLTRVRTAWGMIVLSIIVISMLQRNVGTARLITVAAIALLFTSIAISYMPRADRILSQVESIANIGRDSSFQGRVQIVTTGLPFVLSHPFGLGIGSASGVVRKITGSSLGGIGDNGWLSIACDLGLPGMFLYIAGLFVIGRQAMRLRRSLLQVPVQLVLGLALMVATLAFMVIANTLTSEFAAMSWAIMAGGISIAEGSSLEPSDCEGFSSEC